MDTNGYLENYVPRGTFTGNPRICPRIMDRETFCLVIVKFHKISRMSLQMSHLWHFQWGKWIMDYGMSRPGPTLSHVTHGWVMLHMIESCRIWMIHVTHEWLMTNTRKAFHIWMGHVSYEWAMSDMNESCHIWRRFMYDMTNMSKACHIWMGHVTHINKSCHT